MSADNDYASEYRNDPRSTDELFTLALTKDADRATDNGSAHRFRRFPKIGRRCESTDPDFR